MFFIAGSIAPLLNCLIVNPSASAYKGKDDIIFILLFSLFYKKGGEGG